MQQIKSVCEYCLFWTVLLPVDAWCTTTPLKKKIIHTSQNQKTESDNGQSNKKPGKVFTEDEGEYVDFEEFKD